MTAHRIVLSLAAVVLAAAPHLAGQGRMTVTPPAPTQPAVAPPSQVINMNAMQMLDLYESDRPLAVKSLGTNLHLGSVFDEIRGKGESWIAARGRAEEERRRLVLATFLLEVINVQDPVEWSWYDPPGPPMAQRLIEWMCDDFRSRHMATPLVRTWYLALIAMLEHRGDRRYIAQHLLHAEQRFPGDPRWLLIRARLAAHDGGGRGPCFRALESDHMWETCDAPFFSNSEELYEQAMHVPAIAAEARVELARLHLKREHNDTAIALLSDVDLLTDDVNLRYVAAVMRAWVYAAKHDTDGAMTSYRLALNAVPNAQTAAVGLAANLLVSPPSAKARDEAAALIEAALTSHVPDPWVTHRENEYARWNMLITQLRDELK